MADSADQVEKHTLFLRLAVSIYKMKDDELKLLLETLDPDVGNTPGSSGGHPVRSQSVTDDPMQRQMMLARIFVLLKQSDTGTLLTRLRALKDPAFNWVRAYPRTARWNTCWSILPPREEPIEVIFETSVPAGSSSKPQKSSRQGRLSLCVSPFQMPMNPCHSG